MPEFYCFPVCRKCREAGECTRKEDLDIVAPSDPLVMRRQSNPWGGDMVMLPCGCFTLPWGFIEYFGQNITKIFCDVHGWHTLTKSQVKRMKTEKDIIRERYEKTRKDEALALFGREDIPPF